MSTDRADSVGDDAASSPLTYLVDSETNAHPLQSQSRAQYRIHSPYKRLRDQTINALHESGRPDLMKRAQKMGMCCVAPTVYVGRGAVPSCSPGRCRDRCCPTCAMFRAGSLRSRLRRMLEKSNSVRFLTLTMKPASVGLGKCIDALHRAFRLLRKSLAWRDHVRGGCFVVEITRGSEGKHWHVHLHALIDGKYFPHEILHDAWSVAVGERSRAEIKAVYGRDGLAGYLTGYLAAGSGDASWTFAEIQEFAMEMKGRRTMGTFGTWHRVKTDNLDAEAPEPIRPDVSLSFTAVEAVLDCEPELREAAAPLLSRLSATWRLLMKPYVSDLRWLDAPMDAKSFASLTSVLLEIQEVLTHKPMTAKEIRLEADRLRRRRRALERCEAPLFGRMSHGKSGSVGASARDSEAEARRDVASIQAHNRGRGREA